MLYQHTEMAQDVDTLVKVIVKIAYKSRSTDIWTKHVQKHSGFTLYLSLDKGYAQ